MVEQHLVQQRHQIVIGIDGLQRLDDEIGHRRLVALIPVKAQINRQRGKGRIGGRKDGDVIGVAHRVGQTSGVKGCHEDVEVVRPGGDIDNVHEVSPMCD